MRIKNTIGTHYINNGKVSDGIIDKIVIDYSRKFYLFNINPVAKPRMTMRDKWLNPPRPVVASYRAFKDEFSYQCNLMKFKLKIPLDIIFFIAMPLTWSQKKKQQMNGMPNENIPDLDNYIKAVCDSLGINDKIIWKINSEKRWAFFGSILIYD